MSLEYTENEVCRCCGFEGAKTYLFHVNTERNNVKREPMYLCEVCSSTNLSTAVKYPQQVDDVNLHRAIGWIANKILSIIDKRGV